MKRFKFVIYTECREGNQRVRGNPLREYDVVAGSDAQAVEMVKADVDADLPNLPYTMDRIDKGDAPDESVPRLSRVT